VSAQELLAFRENYLWSFKKVSVRTRPSKADKCRAKGQTIATRLGHVNFEISYPYNDPLLLMFLLSILFFRVRAVRLCLLAVLVCFPGGSQPEEFRPHLECSVLILFARGRLYLLQLYHGIRLFHLNFFLCILVLAGTVPIPAFFLALLSPSSLDSISEIECCSGVSKPTKSTKSTKSTRGCGACRGKRP
jgi:hypothetical protein